MRTFAELLSEHVTRVGISDSELARTLGVRRQTIFRWKQGLVEKPRHRDDILRLAERLRLSSIERDELLLAAGFPPEAPVPIPEPPPPFADTADVPVPPPAVDAAFVTIPPTRRPVRSTLRKLALGLVPLALGTVVLLVLVRNSIPDARFPVAQSGEILVVIGQLGSVESPGETARRLPAGNDRPPAPDLGVRVRIALEREFGAEQYSAVRVALWPEMIEDQKTAEAVRQRTHARIVVGGFLQGDALVTAVAIAPAASRIDDLPLDALVTVPSDLRLRISAEPEQVQVLALLVLSQLYVDGGDLALARAELTRALSLLPTPPPALYAYLGYVLQISQPPDLDQATRYYTLAIEGAPDAPTAFLNRGVAYVRQDDAAKWQPDLIHALALNADPLAARQALCWALALAKQPELALPHCNLAVQLDSTGRSRDGRAIVYAEMERLSDAATDWQAFVTWLEQRPESLRVRYGSSRNEWLQRAQAGQNPMDTSTLAGLRRE